MNIYDCYITNVYTIVNVEYKKDFIRTTTRRFDRTTIVLKKEKYGIIEYYDILQDKIVNPVLTDCDIGDEFIDTKESFIHLYKHLGYSGKSDVSTRKIKKLIMKKAKSEKMKKENEHI